MDVNLEQSRKVSEALQHELKQRGEQLIQLTGALATSLNKQTGVHANLQRCAKQFASLQVTMDGTTHLLHQLETLNEQLRSQTAMLVESTARVALVVETSERCALLCRSVSLPSHCIARDPALCPVCHPDASAAALTTSVVGDESSHVHSAALRRSTPRHSKTDVLRMAFDLNEDDDGDDDDSVVETKPSNVE